MGNRRPGQGLLRHWTPTQSTGVGTLWAAEGSPGPSHHPWPSSTGCLEWVVLHGMEIPHASLLPQFLWEEGQGEASDTGHEDKVRSENWWILPSSQGLKDILWSRSETGGAEEGQGFWEQGWFYGCKLCGHTRPHT